LLLKSGLWVEKVLMHLLSPGVMTGDLIGFYYEDPRSQKRDLGHPSLVSWHVVRELVSFASKMDA